MKERPVLLSLIVGLLAVGMATYAQQKRKPQPHAGFDQQPFDLSRDVLPPNYSGHSFPVLYAAAARREVASRKGEYETTNDYENRLARLNSLPLVASLKSDSLFALVIGPVRQDYDADAKTVHLSLALSSHDGGASLTGTWLHTQKLIGSYIGRNAFNRAVRVKAYRYDDYLLKVDRSLALRMSSFDGATDAFTSSIVVGPLDAQKVRPHVRAVLLCELSSVSSDKDHDGPTIDEPYDEYTFKYTMNVIPRGVWFFDSSTGFVLARVGLAKEVPPIAKKPGCPPTITYQPEPKYTEEARTHEITGTVELSALFTVSGEITEIEVIKGLSYGLTERAIEGAKSIKFISPVIDGKKMPCRMTLEYNFNLY